MATFWGERGSTVKVEVVEVEKKAEVVAELERGGGGSR